MVWGYCIVLLKAQRPAVEDSRMRKLAIEVLKTFISWNPEFMT